MAITTNLSNRIKNTPLPNSQGLMPLFEAVQNSIQAIEELEQDSSKGKITVHIIRSPQANFSEVKRRGPDTHADIVGFQIDDNGIGFTDQNMDSFQTLDSELKASIGGRGVGRLLWLKVFQYAEIRSVYLNEAGKKYSRNFRFTAKNGVSLLDDKSNASKVPIKTSVLLSGFDSRYRDHSPKTAETISTHLFEHCLWYFVRDGGAPNILIKDGETTINLDEIYEMHMCSSADRETDNVKGHEFEFVHLKLRAAHHKSHRIGWCASNRLVKEEPLTNKLPGLHGKMAEGENEFIYLCYVKSKYLDDRVRPERTEFVLDKVSENDLFSESEFTQEELTQEVLSRVEVYLGPYLAPKIEAGKRRVDDFVSEKKPSYRPILSHISEEEKCVDPEISDRDLEVFLHKHKAAKERELLSEGHNVMSPGAQENLADYNSRVQDYLQLADDIKKSDLAEYVSHRKVILDLLAMAITRNESGQYAREELIHELIMPLQKTSNSYEFERNNLWLINERLAFHDFLASDKTLRSMPITGSAESKEPDILALNVYDEPLLVSEGDSLPLASITVVELKRPMRNDAHAGEGHDPIDQALGYLERIREGKVLTATGRPIPNSGEIPGFCYIICDLTPTIKKRCERANLTITSDKLGYFGYNQNYKTYIEVISFDQLLKAGKERNRAFFDQLGLPSN